MKKIILTAALAVFAQSAHAATFTYMFEASNGRVVASDATVDTVADTAAALIGTTLTGTLTFDDTFVSGDAVVRDYAPPVITIDQIDLSGVAPFTATRLRNDALSFDGYSGLSDLPATSGDLVSRIFFTLRDTDGTVIGDTGFPPLPALSEFEITALAFLGNVTGEANARERTDFDFTKLELVPDVPPIPLPAPALLLLGGLGGLMALRRRRKT